MVDTQVEFFDGVKGKIFRVIRTPKKSKGTVVYVQPFFELANINRHVYTRSMLKNYHLSLTSVLFDHYGTGDSEGGLTEVDLSLWQQDLHQQICKIKQTSQLPVVLVVFASASLLLSQEIIESVEHIQLWQPEFSGKKIVKQLKRIALLDKTKYNEAAEIIELSGYKMKSLLLEEVNLSHFSCSEDNTHKFSCFDIVENSSEMNSVSREKQLKLIINENAYYRVPDRKYWQATELVVPDYFLEETTKFLEKRLFNA